MGFAEKQGVRSYNRDGESTSSSSSRPDSTKNNISIGKKRFPFKWPIDLKVGILQPDESTSSVGCVCAYVYVLSFVENN